MRLIPEWRHVWRMRSTWLHAAQIALIGGWTQIPQDLRSSVPSWAEVALSGVIFGLGIIARVVAQDSVPKPAQDATHD